MKRLLLISFLACHSQCSLSQNRLFREQIERIANTRDTIYEIDQVSPENKEFDFTVEDISRLEDLLMTYMQKRSNRTRAKLVRSSILSEMAEAATSAWKGSQYADKKKWSKLQKYFSRAKHATTGNFNLLYSFSFRIDLLDKGSGGYYYDRNGPDGQLNLYEGKRPVTKEEKEAEPIPLRFFSELELINQLATQLNRKRITNGLKKGTYSFVGLNIEVDERSLFANKIPTARVVIFVGAKRLQKIRV